MQSTGSEEQRVTRPTRVWRMLVLGFVMGATTVSLAQCNGRDPRTDTLMEWATQMSHWAIHVQDDHLCPTCRVEHTQPEMDQGDHIRPPGPPL